MANGIVTIEDLLALFQSEAKIVSTDGRAEFSRRGCARLSSKSPRAIGKLLKKLETGEDLEELETLRPFAGESFEGGDLPDVLVSAILGHYALQGEIQCMRIVIALGSVGLRSLVQQAHGWNPAPTRRFTQSEIIEMCCLPVPSEWQRRFPEEYYDQLSRLTKLNAFGNLRPALWAAKTKELVYDYLPDGIYAEVKRCKAETGSFDKLHQFLSDDGLRILEQHQRTLLTLMAASSSLEQLKTLLQQSCTGTYQLLLIG